MSSFQINSTDPPEEGYPSGDAYFFVLPEPSGLDGQGRPVGAVGLPRLELRFEFLPTNGFEWYAGFVGESNYVALSSLRAWNPYADGGNGDWETYTSAIMHRPTQEGFTFGGYQSVVVRFTELE